METPAQPPPSWPPQYAAAPIPYAAVARPQLEHDRRGGLIAFGIISIVIGSLAGCLAVLSPFSLMAMSFAPGAVAPREVIIQIVITTVIYGAAAVLFIWTGIGSIRCQRWVRPIVISLGWPTIIAGFFTLAGWVLFARDLPAVMAAAAKVSTPPGARPPPPPNTAALAAVAAVAMIVFYVIVPGAFVWFYSTRNVRLTLEAYDPTPSWTQRCPLPLFIGAVNLLLGGLLTLSLAPTGSVPFFGQYIQGALAGLLAVAAAVAMIAASVLFYRVNLLGWFIALAVVSVGFLSAIVTFTRLGITEFYTRGNVDHEILRVIENSPTMTGPIPIIFIAAAYLVCVTYLLWARRYFTVRPGEPRTATAPAQVQ